MIYERVTSGATNSLSCIVEMKRMVGTVGSQSSFLTANEAIVQILFLLQRRHSGDSNSEANETLPCQQVYSVCYMRPSLHNKETVDWLYIHTQLQD